MSAPETSWSLRTWLAIAASLWLGFLSWVPPVFTFWFMAMLSGRERWIGLGEMAAGAVAAAILTMAAPLAVMAWRGWRRAATAYGVGIAVGAVPTVWAVATFVLVAAR